MISVSENTAVATAALPPLGGSDRQAAHYYRAQHARALEREEGFKEKAQAAEQIIVQLLVLIGWLLVLLTKPNLSRGGTTSSAESR